MIKYIIAIIIAFGAGYYFATNKQTIFDKIKNLKINKNDNDTTK